MCSRVSGKITGMMSVSRQCFRVKWILVSLVIYFPLKWDGSELTMPNFAVYLIFFLQDQLLSKNPYKYAMKFWVLLCWEYKAIRVKCKDLLWTGNFKKNKQRVGKNNLSYWKPPPKHHCLWERDRET